MFSVPFSPHLYPQQVSPPQMPLTSAPEAAGHRPGRQREGEAVMAMGHPTKVPATKAASYGPGQRAWSGAEGGSLPQHPAQLRLRACPRFPNPFSYRRWN